MEFTVAQDGSGDFPSVQKCVDAIPADFEGPVGIFIRKGRYKEKLDIVKPFVTLIGENAKETILTYDDCAGKRMPDGKKMGTFRSYSTRITGEGFRAENITFENAAGQKGRVGQALAAYVDADKVCFRNCRFLGFQDTLFTGPPPQDAGDLEWMKKEEIRRNGRNRQLYDNCYLEGDVDFIFGSATAVFRKCEIFSKNRDKKVNGYITAASTPESRQYGYVFMDCQLTGDAGPQSVYLGRPWRKYAKVAFLDCQMGSHIIGEGWNNWRDREKEKTVSYVEYNSSGPGAKRQKRVSWSRCLTSEEASKYQLENIFPENNSWYI